MRIYLYLRWVLYFRCTSKTYVTDDDTFGRHRYGNSISLILIYHDATIPNDILRGFTDFSRDAIMVRHINRNIDAIRWHTGALSLQAR